VVRAEEYELFRSNFEALVKEVKRDLCISMLNGLAATK
jgi:hypothetical protein